MSTTVKYKGATLATVTNQTKTLLTSGTWLEDDIELTDVTAGGATDMVKGSFTTSSTSGAQTISIPYTGSGYPVAGIIYPTGGLNNSTLNSLVQRYVIVQWAFSKLSTTTAPTYGTSGGTANYGVATISYKNSTSNATTYGQTTQRSANVYYSSASTANTSTVVKFNNANTLNIFVAASSYGFKSSTSYSYVFLYSS